MRSTLHWREQTLGRRTLNWSIQYMEVATHSSQTTCHRLTLKSSFWRQYNCNSKIQNYIKMNQETSAGNMPIWLLQLLQGETIEKERILWQALPKGGTALFFLYKAVHQEVNFASEKMSIVHFKISVPSPSAVIELSMQQKVYLLSHSVSWQEGSQVHKTKTPMLYPPNLPTM